MTDFIFKFIIIGDSGVGKSCLLMQFTENRFSAQHDITIGVEFGARIIKVAPPVVSLGGNSAPVPPASPNHDLAKVVKIQVWDTAGQEHFRSITRSYFRGAVGALLVFDLCSRDSFAHVQDWLRDCRENSSNSYITIALVANKTDLCVAGRQREVTQEEARAFAERHALLYVETSAKSGEGVFEAFEVVAQGVCEKVQRGLIDAETLRGDKNRVMPPSASSPSRDCC